MNDNRPKRSPPKINFEVNDLYSALMYVLFNITSGQRYETKILYDAGCLNYYLSDGDFDNISLIIASINEHPCHNYPFTVARLPDATITLAKVPVNSDYVYTVTLKRNEREYVRYMQQEDRLRSFLVSLHKFFTR